MNLKLANKKRAPKNLIYSYSNNMDKQDLSNLTKEQLINLLLKQNTKIQLLKNKLQKPVPAKRTNVKQMVQEYEKNIIPPPPEFRDDYKPVPKPRTIKRPVPAPRINVKQMVKDYEKKYYSTCTQTEDNQETGPSPKD